MDQLDPDKDESAEEKIVPKKTVTEESDTYEA
jgi:hypothetical protein